MNTFNIKNVIKLSSFSYKAMNKINDYHKLKIHYAILNAV